MPQAGFGQTTVRAQIQAITVASPPPGSFALGYRCLSRVSASLRIHCPYARTSAASPSAFRQSRIWESQGPGRRAVDLGSVAGSSTSALFMRTATGFRSDANGFETQALCFERNGAAASERVEDRPEAAARRLQDLRVRRGQKCLVASILPDHEPLNQFVESFTLLTLKLLRRELYWK